jgi:hypothetical protein
MHCYQRATMNPYVSVRPALLPVNSFLVSNPGTLYKPQDHQKCAAKSQNARQGLRGR